MRSQRCARLQLLVLWLVAAASTAEQRKTYDGHRVYDVAVANRSQASQIRQLVTEGGFELWDDKGGSSGWLQVQVGPDDVPRLESVLNTSDVPFRLRIGDVQSIIDSQQSENEAHRAGGRAKDLLRDGSGNSSSRAMRKLNAFPGFGTNADNRRGRLDSGSDRDGAELETNSIYDEEDDDSDIDGFNLGAYHRFSDIEALLRRLPTRFPDHVTLHVIGRTHEGRPLYLVRLREDVSAPATKPVMWIDCGVHAREWISPAICLYTIGRLLAGDQRWLVKYDWHLVPVMNPDGYEYSHTHDRLWRKNRRPVNYCTGVDLNRNFAARWGTFGVTFLECGLTFPGYRPFSELESRAVRDAVLRDRRRIAAFNSVHSYGQLWLLPYGYSWFASKDIGRQRRVGRAATRAMRAVNGVPYRYGISSRVLYLDSGTSTDWAYRAGVRHSVAIEARDKGFYGFLLPPRLILPTAREVWAGLAQQARMLAR
ncbi:Carboxypeptidase O [Amphibalanus amphitrite]|uniref:Carboxypeptidase O n=1 Tax=Amphibalanus amphitrite TaxID=1232801 RepID=A0A6A4WN44_AMPAM|nr:carboxypeptidase B-like [Amphibalanus amphitrite]KAF0308777.1 Carboxypeptidase O [Amphibalanus amphitrite]